MKTVLVLSQLTKKIPHVWVGNLNFFEQRTVEWLHCCLFDVIDCKQIELPVLPHESSMNLYTIKRSAFDCTVSSSSLDAKVMAFKPSTILSAGRSGNTTHSFTSFRKFATSLNWIANSSFCTFLQILCKIKKKMHSVRTISNCIPPSKVSMFEEIELSYEHLSRNLRNQSIWCDCEIKI